MGQTSGISYRRIENLRSGEAYIRQDELFSLARYFQIEPTRIYKGKTLTDALRDAQTVGERIRILLYSRGLTITKLAQELDVPYQTILRWTNLPAGASFSAGNLALLSNYFKIEPILLLKGKTLTDALGDTEEEAIGERIKILRDSRCLTQEQLEQDLGLIPGIISRWEQGEPPLLRNIKLLTNFFEIEPTLLLKGKTLTDAFGDTRSI